MWCWIYSFSFLIVLVTTAPAPASLNILHPAALYVNGPEPIISGDFNSLPKNYTLSASLFIYIYIR